MKTADQFLSEGAATFKERNAVYGNNYLNVGNVMVGLFPDGVTLKTADDWNRMHIFLLAIVKKTRYCNQWAQGGHADSIHDSMVYDAMLESIDAEMKDRRPCGLCNTPGTCSSLLKCRCYRTHSGVR